MQNHKEQIHHFLKRYHGEAKLQDDTDLFESGYVNSLFTVQLVLFLEETFGISVLSEDLDIKNFNTVSHIVSFVEAKQKC